MATMDRPDDKGKKVPGSDGYDYLPAGAKFLTMEQKFQLKILGDQSSKLSKVQLFGVLMDALVLNMNQLNTFKKIIKEDEKRPEMPKAADLEKLKENLGE